jgi:molybdopterin converting factor small subunit
VKIHLKTSFDHNENELETQSRTLGNLLLELSKKYPKANFYNKERREVSFDFFVELNGEQHDTIPDELDTRLKDGDKVEIYTGAEFPED